ncbi:MAG: hypothetical protein ACRDWE_11555, partial [Acidimicrobiales bacterium]
MSDVRSDALMTAPAPKRAPLSDEAMGTFDESGNYVPRPITEDDLSGASLEDLMAGTLVEFDDGDVVEGTVVKIDRDEVLL